MFLMVLRVEMSMCSEPTVCAIHVCVAPEYKLRYILTSFVIGLSQFYYRYELSEIDTSVRYSIVKDVQYTYTSFKLFRI